MFLTAYNLAHFLMSKGLLDPASVADGDFTVAEAGRRNRNFKVRLGPRPGLFVKQVKILDPSATATIQREASFFKLIQTSPKYAALKALTPEFVHYEPRRHAVTTRLADQAESLAEKQGREGVYREDIAHLLGHALGIAHPYGPVLAADPDARGLFACQLPWPLTLDQTGYSFLNSLGAIGPQLAQSIQQAPGLQPALSALRPEWQFDSLVHGDMKFDNCLIRTMPGGQVQLTIVDWELCDLGDAAWDVASIYKDLLMAVLVSAQNPQASPQVTFDTVRPAMRAFWTGYCAARPQAATLPSLDKMIRYTGARMVLAVLEYLWNAPAMSPLGRQILETAQWLLHSTLSARVQMIGY